MMEERGWEGGRTRMEGSRSAEEDSRKEYYRLIEVICFGLGSRFSGWEKNE